MNSIIALMNDMAKEWCAYDADRDCFITPPEEILVEIDKTFGGLQESVFQNIIDQNPLWLYDENRCYY